MAAPQAGPKCIPYKKVATCPFKPIKWYNQPINNNVANAKYNALKSMPGMKIKFVGKVLGICKNKQCPLRSNAYCPSFPSTPRAQGNGFTVAMAGSCKPLSN